MLAQSFYKMIDFNIFNFSIFSTKKNHEIYKIIFEIIKYMQDIK